MRVPSGSSSTEKKVWWEDAYPSLLANKLINDKYELIHIANFTLF